VLHCLPHAMCHIDIFRTRIPRVSVNINIVTAVIFPATGARLLHADSAVPVDGSRYLAWPPTSPSLHLDFVYALELVEESWHVDIRMSVGDQDQHRLR